jgi:DNA polymerase I-like protein with 3'-5' exonuclease and polymerase domains
VARNPRRHDTQTRNAFDEPAALHLLARPDNYVPDAPPERLGERRICLDFETDGLEWWAGSKAVGASYLFPESGRRGYVSWGHKGGGNSCDEETAVRWLRREIRDLHVDNSNTKFDIHTSRATGADLVTQNCTFGDVGHRAALLDDHRFRFGIDQLAHDFLGPDRGKLQLPVSDKGRLHELPAWVVAPYAVEDVCLVNDLVDVTQPDIIAQELLEVLLLEQQIIPVVVEMEKNGAYLDVETLFRWRDEARAEYEEALHRVFRATGIRVTSPDSNKQLQAVFKRAASPSPRSLTRASRPLLRT